MVSVDYGEGLACWIGSHKWKILLYIVPYCVTMIYMFVGLVEDTHVYSTLPNSSWGAFLFSDPQGGGGYYSRGRIFEGGGLLKFWKLLS